jgi:transposase-like protein
MARTVHDPIFTDETAAREHLESVLWPDGPVCPRCGERERVAKLEGAAYRPGLYHCKSCRRQFSVTVGTAYERSHVPLHKWLLATHLLCASKKEMSAHQLHRMLGVTYKTAWFMEHRIREGMREAKPGGLGGSDKTVEADETYFGDKDGAKKTRKKGARGPSGKRMVLGLVERGGKARTVHVKDVTAANVADIVRRNLSRESALMTDESKLYTKRI